MFSQIDFRIHDDKIEVAGQEFLLGELTVDILSISPQEFEAMYALSQNLDEESIQKLHDMLMSKKLFQLILESGKLYPAENYQRIVSDIYSFNETMFWFIDQALMHLKKLDSENYAAALYDFYSQPNLDKMMVNHFRNGAHTFTLFDTIDVRYVPDTIPNQPDTYVIYEVYSVKYLQAFLKMDFMKAIMNGHTIRRCKNCKRFFLLTKGYKTDYCDRPIEGKKNRTCRNQGAKNKAKEKAANNPVIHSYTNAYQRITADKQRGNITVEDWKKAKSKIADLRDMAISGRFSDREVDAQMQSEALYQSLGIVKIGGR